MYVTNSSQLDVDCCEQMHGLLQRAIFTLESCFIVFALFMKSHFSYFKTKTYEYIFKYQLMLLSNSES